MTTTSDTAVTARTVADREQIFIGGHWVDSAGDEWIDLIDPWSEQRAARIRSATGEDVARAVQSARRSFDSGVWSGKSMAERADVIDEIATRLERRIDELTTLGVLEVGVPVTVSAMTQQMSAGLFRAVAAEARQFEQREDRVRADGGVSRILREPTGVVAAIIPWNGPIGTIAFKVAPALAAGCSVILKAAPDAPLSPAVFADVIAELVDEGRIPEGVVSVLVADREVSESLVTNTGVDHITFTGSTTAGRRIAALAGDRIARVSLELGGKSAAIILDDADLGHVLQSLPMGGCMQSGQACIALTRVLVSRARHDEVVAALSAAYSALPMGNPWEPTTILGPLAGERHRDRVRSYIAGAVADGAQVIAGGHAPEGVEQGYFVAPTLLDGVRNDMRVAQEEVFGPVISVITYEDEDDAVAIANDSIYGLSGAVYTEDLERGYAVAQRIRTGTVSVNGSVIDFTLPFGGYKQSGLGREGGIEGLEEFFETKTVHMPAPAQ
ncbi:MULTISPECIES: aldehyde dehydrogenase [Nocardia]|jgi:betaine-aldehyde dehydrogenase|uniref:Aldehyde dehydrogenase n=1 Tax=Nocardia nova TaxID=37330 RepID=A0A2S5ZXR2_9NOCA|nr:MULTISPECIES: aldehyde dehydrogenase [Nocardia]OBF66734.1 aldehyde dehydrogenase [Mycobacterium sp. 852002-51759_SCH5129042]MBF6277501.1 aldehyde dehydrogenase [Nocardia nova]OBA53466.1 aldehyde dehydrogenase [Nocardia sp. 852002-51101_SCH5132738]OBB47983.1 aldehyde dehydrogenase [Nocardia sp. 852002-51244_SCH5132740]PPJ22710.1 aldehyde dehydrogenase [Nocardia nova]